MFDFAWSEIAVIAVVALLVIGPKDLPRVLRTAGQWVGRARAIAREFQNSLDQMIREAELDEVKKEVEKAASFNLGAELENTIDPGREIQKTLSEPLVTESLPKPADAPPPPQAAAPEPPASSAPEPAPAVAEAAEAAATETPGHDAPQPATSSGTHG